MQAGDKSRYYLKAAAIGGAAGGALSAIPFVNWCNCLCCLWVLGAGFLAVYLVQRWSNLQVTPGEGATVGVLAGLIAGVVDSIISVPLMTAQRTVIAAQIARMPPNIRPVMEQLLASGALSAMTVVAWLVVGAIFGTFGGLLGAAILSKRQ